MRVESEIRIPTRRKIAYAAVLVLALLSNTVRIACLGASTTFCAEVSSNHATWPHRLQEKLKKAFVETTYLPEHNQRFAQAAASAEDFHRGVPRGVTLDTVFQLEETHVLSNDWVVRYHTRYFQLARQSGHAPARSTVLVREDAGGAIEIRYRGRLLRWAEIPAPPPKSIVAPPAAQMSAAATGRRAWRPSADHPWRRDYAKIQQRVVELARRGQ